MHYQHRFHAGNFADVFKHALLAELLAALNAKPAPWCYLETHGGSGMYELDDVAARRTGESREGIGRLQQTATLPAALQTYWALVRRANDNGALRRYPGSPLFALMLARPQDRVIVCEKVPEVAAELRALLADDPRASVHVRDGYESIALLPPKERRGLVLIDPPFERVDEFDAVADFLATALKRFGNGVFAVWYPHKNRYQTERWLRRVRSMLAHEALDLQLDTGAPSEGQMHACGLLVVNPPYAFAQRAPDVLSALRPLLAVGPAARTEAQSWPRAKDPR